MFKLQPNPTFTAAVALSVPGKGRAEAVDFEFKHLPRRDIKSFFESLQTEDQSDADALKQIIVGWKGIDVPFSEAALQSLLENYPTAAGELFDAFRSEMLESRRKN